MQVRHWQEGFVQQLAANDQPVIQGSKRLAGKAVLMVGGLGDNGRFVNGRLLAGQLAAHGANLALVYTPTAAAQSQAQEIQRLAHSWGQACILITMTLSTTPQQIMQQVLHRLGGIDIFLDLTAERDGLLKGKTHQSAAWPMLLAVMRHMAGGAAQHQNKLTTQLETAVAEASEDHHIAKEIVEETEDLE
jgi:NAD(P)-dependent dehydrogenase (short-subunit alcohol dehydrogenase family)